MTEQVAYQSASRAGATASGDVVAPAVPTGQLIRFCRHECLQCTVPTYKSKMRAVIDRVAAYYEIEPQELTGRGRVQHVANARHLAAYLLVEMFPNSRLQAIAEVLGYKDRSGMGHAATDFEMQLETNAELREDLETLRGLVS